jgi:transcription-repair coupling factor (superfamily II helicase)
MAIAHAYDSQIAALAQHVADGDDVITLGYLTGTSKALCLASLTQRLQRPLLVVTSTATEADALVHDLRFLTLSAHPSPRVILFPAEGHAPYEPASETSDLTSQRLVALRSMLQSDVQVIVTTPEALVPYVMPRGQLQEVGLELTTGLTIERQELVERLLRCGYHQVDLVEEWGDFGVRGGIIDLFPPHLPRPIRLEFVGDEIESLREFDLATQRSMRTVDQLTLVPLREFIKGLPAWDEIEHRASAVQLDLARLREIVACLEQYIFPPGVERLLPLFSDALEPFFNYLHPNAVLVLDEPAVLTAKLEEFHAAIEEGYQQALLRQDLVAPPPQRYLAPAMVTECFQACQRVVLQTLAEDLRDSPETELLSGQVLGSYQGRWGTLVQLIATRLQEGFTILITAASLTQARHIQDLLREAELAAEVLSTPPDLLAGLTQASQPASTPRARLAPPPRTPPTSHLLICVGSFSSSFVLPAAQLMCVDASEIWGTRRGRDRRARPSARARLFNYRDLNPGDHIVHLDYGIGLYRGTTILKVGTEESEFLSLEFADHDRVYVPIEALHLVQKYLGAGGEPPPLSKLGSGTWSRTKRRVKAAIREIARELLRLYAAREVKPGYAFSPDTSWHQGFTEAFEFEETEDQLRAIEDVKGDMEKPHPMDRLVCGDVGYGKTEVALRAAFKAMMDGKQVAMLVPTTILALQHWHTFSRRFAPYPITVEMLSRFRLPIEQKKVVEGLRTGKVDLVIGTHRLLQKDIEFQNLGLLIIDEEHRFGVAHKERIKQRYTQVDALTLTATPIPRTLHLSMVGVRDMSVIETPPPNRLAVRTYVLKFGDAVIQEAITRELDRGGQVFFVHNRVESIGAMYRYLHHLVPQARIAVAHGQLPEQQLERVMVRFIEREVDVLLCTTIIESGLDIPSANTIIVNRADRFGLAQLYQLRGRVGRDQDQAYAYLLIPGEHTLTGLPWERLKAMLEFADLGAGLRLAMRDLEIRGAGNILGVQQSGHIGAVGFDLYCKLMEETIRELKGEQVEEEKEVQVVLKIGGFLPKDYIPNTSQRLDLYQRLYAVDSESRLAELQAELIDRFGVLPEAVEKLLRLVELRTLARQLRLLKIERRQQTVVFVFDPATPVPPETIVALLHAHRRILRFLPDHTLELRLTQDGWAAVCNAVKKVLQQLLQSDTILAG